MARIADPFAMMLVLAGGSACGQDEGRDPTLVWTTHDWTARWALLHQRPGDPAVERIGA